jgi:8-oxo-dGTP diphosphatase
MDRDKTEAVPRIELAAAVVLHRGRVLLVRRSLKETFLPGEWALPCGKLDDNETSDVAVLRELREETGLDGAVVDYAGKLSFMSIWRGREVENIQSNYLVVLSAQSEFPRVDPPETDQQAKWLPTGEIENFGLDDHNLAAIRQGLRAADRVS